MTGGRFPYKDDPGPNPHVVRVPFRPHPEQLRASELFQLWVQAAAFRRAVNRRLRRYRATFSQWRMLHAAELLVEEVGDMVSQQEIGRRAGIDANTVSSLMFRLADRGWLSWGPDARDYAYRIFVTDEGKAFLAATRALILRAAVEIWGPGCASGREPTSFAP